jgi:DNA-binding beta-propeller fold protein YncE
VSAADAVWVGVTHGRGDSRIVRIDTAANRVVARTPVAGSPFQMAAGEDAVWVTGNFDRGSDVLHRIDTETNRVAATIRFPGRYAGPVAAGEDAVWLVLTGRGRTSNELARIDPETNRVERIVRLGVARGRLIDEIAVGEGAVWLLALLLGESAEQPGDLIRFDPESNEIAAIVHANALNMGVGEGGVWVTGCVDCDQQRDTFFAQEIDTVANAPVGPRFAVDHVAFGPLLVATDSVWFSGYGAHEETIAFRLDPRTSAIEPFVRLSDFLHTDVLLDERADTLWVASPPRSVIRADVGRSQLP